MCIGRVVACSFQHGAWRINLPIEFEDVADEENEQEFNPNQSEDEMCECESESDSSSCAGGEYILKLESLKHI
jgi:hypothetical protein